MNNNMNLLLIVFMALFLERLIYTARLREPEGTILDPSLARVAMGVYIFICFFALAEAFFVIDKQLVFLLTGLGFSFIGVYLRRASINALGSNWSSYIRNIYGQKIVRTGPYKYFKHPYYLAVFFELLGVVTFCQAKTALAILLIVQVPVLFMRMRIEDRFLVQKFGDGCNNDS
jgi:protein-S-isoprenylcysteine O-methyltransferase Ste14